MISASVYVIIIDEMEFLETAEIDIDLDAMGIRTRLPVLMLDRHSPLSYSIAQYVHWDLAVHRGAETCSRISMEHVSIMQGSTLYREIGQNCPRCAMKRNFGKCQLLCYSVHISLVCINSWGSRLVGSVGT